MNIDHQRRLFELVVHHQFSHSVQRNCQGDYKSGMTRQLFKLWLHQAKEIDMLSRINQAQGLEIARLKNMLHKLDAERDAANIKAAAKSSAPH